MGSATCRRRAAATPGDARLPDCARRLQSVRCGIASAACRVPDDVARAVEASANRMRPSCGRSSPGICTPKLSARLRRQVGALRESLAGRRERHRACQRNGLDISGGHLPILSTSRLDERAAAGHCSVPPRTAVRCPREVVGARQGASATRVPSSGTRAPEWRIRLAPTLDRLLSLLTAPSMRSAIWCTASSGWLAPMRLGRALSRSNISALRRARVLRAGRSRSESCTATVNRGGQPRSPSRLTR